MRIGNAPFVLAAAVMVSMAPLSAQVPRAITLQEALQRSLAVQPNVIQAANQIRTGELRTRSAWGAYLPTLTGSSGGSRNFSEGVSRIDPSTGQLISGDRTTQNVNFGLNAGIELFDGFRRSNELKSARAAEDASEANYVDVQFQNALTTTEAFFAALSAQQQLRVRTAAVERAEEQFKVAVARLQAGAANRSDSLRSFVTRGQAQLQRLQQEVTLATAEANLGRLVGSTERVAALDDSAFYRPPVMLDTLALRQEALSVSPRVRNAELSLRAAEATASQARSTYWPTLNLALNQNWSGNNINDYQLFQSRSASLTVNWQFFNRFGREQQAEQASLNVINAEVTAEEARRQVVANLTQRLAELGSAEQQVEFARTNVEAAIEDLRIVNERYKVGVATIVDVVTSQEQLTTAEVQLVDARFAFLRAKAQLEAILGRTLQ